MKELIQLKNPFYRPVQFWYDPELDIVWKLRLGCSNTVLEEPTMQEEESVRTLNKVLIYRSRGAPPSAG